MKYIGIKLADGSFYPILEKGKSDKKTLDLTTVTDNQTTVQVDLYGSDTGTMEGAEYVDTLEIRQLEPHPNGEPDLHLEVSLDADDKLHAQVVDPETGKSSETQTVISHALEQRNTSETQFTEDSDTATSEDFELPIPDTNTSDSLSFGEGDDGSTALNLDELAQLGQNTELSVENEQLSSDTVEEETMIGPSVNDETFSFDDSTEPAVTRKVTDEVEHTTDSLTEALSESEDKLDDTMNSISDTLNDMPSIDDTPSSTDLDLPDFGDIDTSTSSDDLDLPDFSESVDDTTATTSTDSSDFDLPDFGDIDTSTSSDDLDLPDFNEETAVSKAASADEDEFALPDFDSSSSSSSFDDTEDNSTFAPSGGLDFNGLYDKETLEGDSSYNDDAVAQTVKKKTKVPVIICIICAIICIIAAILVLFVIPSRINLLTRSEYKSKKEQAQEQIENALAQLPQPVEEAEPEPEPVAEVIVAKEDTIVVAENPATVVPSTPVAATTKAEDIRYKIKWGDTLWDIADAYYKNPWKYKTIARYNGIKNPDKIISGTWILIPAE